MVRDERRSQPRRKDWRRLRGSAVWLSAVLLAACGAGEGRGTEGSSSGPTGSDGADNGATAGEATAAELVVPTADLELEGTLRLPADDEPPATVVIVSGSGPQSRDGQAHGQLGLTLPSSVPVYQELAEGLVERGYGAVTWDKRTCGSFNDCADNDYPQPGSDLEFAALVDDTTAVLDALFDRDDLGDLVLLGHSQGGTVSAAAATGCDDLAGLVLLATPEPAIDEVLQTQAETLTDVVSAAGQSGEEAERTVSEARELADAVSSVADGDLEGQAVGGASREFWAGWVAASRAAPEQVAEFDVPVLVLGAERDWNVLPQQVTAWRDHLDEDDDLIMLPDITHALTRLDTDDVAAITAEDLGTDVESSVPEEIASWFGDAIA